MSSAPSTQDLQLLLDRFNTDDPRAKQELIGRAYDRMMLTTRKLLNSFLRVRTEQQTGDILSEVYLRLSSAIEEVRPDSVRQFMGLVTLEVRRVLLDCVRKMDGRGQTKPPKKVSLSNRPAGADDDGQQHDVPDPVINPDFVLLREVLEAVERLPEEEREVVDLLFLQDMTQREAGELIGVHEDTVKRRWSRSRVKLAEWLQDFDVRT